MNWINAELCKIAVNTFVTTKISYANMISDILDSLLLTEHEREEVFKKTRKDVIELCSKYCQYYLYEE